MKKALKVLAVCLGLAGGAAALAESNEDVPLKFGRLDLADGRKLTNVVVKSYDAKSEKLLIIADGKAMTVPIAAMPPPLDQQLKAAPPTGQTVTTITLPKRSLAPAADQYVQSTPAPAHARNNAMRVATPSVAPPARPRATAPVTRASVDPLLAPAILARHQAIARAHVERYYRYEHRAGSNSISVIALDVELRRPSPVPGWNGRYETTGKAYLEFYDSKGRSFQRTTSTFEVVTEEKLGEELVVIDFTRKS